jgi:hemerythrin-like domain-containing protein
MIKSLLTAWVIFPISFTYGYALKDIDLSPFEFNRYVKPQLISITQDYQSLYLQLNPEMVKLKPLFNSYRELIQESISIRDNCMQKTFESECERGLGRMMKQLNRAIMVSNQDISLVHKIHYGPEQLMAMLAAQSIYIIELNNLHVQVENLFFLKLAKMNLSFELKKLKSDIEKVYSFFYDYLLQAGDPRFGSEFSTFWNDFIKPVNLIILPKNSKEFFIQKINDLNQRLNFLNVILTKRNKPINKQAKTLVKTIHNRWNNILKVSLKRHR